MLDFRDTIQRDRLLIRMYDLAQFMKGLLQRFTHWFNRVHSRPGTLWEERFKSVIVEDGVAASLRAPAEEEEGTACSITWAVIDAPLQCLAGASGNHLA